MQHPLFFAIVVAGCSLAGCRTQPLPERTNDLAEATEAVDLAKIDLACDCNTRPLPDNCRLPCILI